MVAEDGDAAAALTSLRLLMIHLKSFTTVTWEVQPQAGHAPHPTAQSGLPRGHCIIGQQWAEKLGLARIGAPRWFHSDFGSARAHTSSHRSKCGDAEIREVEAGHDGGTQFSSAVGHRRQLLALEAAGRSRLIGKEGQ